MINAILNFFGFGSSANKVENNKVAVVQEQEVTPVIKFDYSEKVANQAEVSLSANAVEEEMNINNYDFSDNSSDVDLDNYYNQFNDILVDGLNINTQVVDSFDINGQPA